MASPDCRLAGQIALVCTGVALAAAGAAAVSSAPASASDHVSTAPGRRVFLLGLRQRGNPGKLARQVSDPSSPLYRRFLSLRQYQKRFSPSAAARRRVLHYLAVRRGVLKLELSSDKSIVLAVLTAQAGRRIFCAKGALSPTRGLCIPKGLRRWAQQISGSEVYVPVRSRPHRARGPAGTSQSCSGAAATGAYTPQQLSTAYGVDELHSRGLDGSGVRVATLSSQEVDPAGFEIWARCFGLPTPVVRQFAMPGAPNHGTDPDETVLDVEALASLAPRLERITPIFVPLDLAFSNSFLLFMFGALDPARQGGKLPDVLSISDGVCESRFTRDQLRLGERLLTEAAALGITALAASGDLGFRGCFINRPGAFFPSSSPFTTSVGGTELTLTAANRIAEQVVWSTFATQGSQGVGTGGGPSDVWPRPSFQRAPGIGPQLQRGKATRLAPDIAAMASFTPGIAVYDQYSGGWGGGGGTSAATPLEAAIVALVIQQERNGGRPRLGSLPPLLYKLARGPDYHAIFFDITKGTSSRHPNSPVGRTPAGGAAQPGYDLATGLGSLNAAAFADAVASQLPLRTH